MFLDNGFCQPMLHIRGTQASGRAGRAPGLMHLKPQTLANHPSNQTLINGAESFIGSQHYLVNRDGSPHIRVSSGKVIQGAFLLCHVRVPYSCLVLFSTSALLCTIDNVIQCYVLPNLRHLCTPGMPDCSRFV